MKSTLIALAAVSGLFLAGAANAQSGAELLKAKGCETCHAMDTKKVGPALKDIAAKHKKDDLDGLTAKVSGAKGHPKVNASEAEVKTMVTYILGLK